MKVWSKHIVREFLNSGKDISVIETNRTGRDKYSVYSGLKQWIKRNEMENIVNVSMICGEVYIYRVKEKSSRILRE